MHIVRYVATMVAALVFVGLTAIPTHAERKPIRIARTEGMGVALRPSPNTGGLPLLRIPDGASPDYLCYTRGQIVSRTDIWFRVRYGGRTGYYYAYYDTTDPQKVKDPARNYGIPWCGGRAMPQKPEEITALPRELPRRPQPPAPARYNREAAVNWALAHARDRQPALYPGCTWFVTQALRSGGLQPDSRWNTEGTHGNPMRGMPGTPSATAAIELVKYLREKYAKQHHWVPMDFDHNRVPLARSGDIVAYDWDGSESIDHLTFVVSIAPGQYPEVAEWGTTEQGNSVSYIKRGWTWSQKEGKWLQQIYGLKVRAWLMHFDLP